MHGPYIIGAMTQYDMMVRLKVILSICMDHQDSSELIRTLRYKMKAKTATRTPIVTEML